MACLGDVLPTPHHLGLPYITAWDVRPLDTFERKRQILDTAEKERWLLVFGHGLDIKSGYLTQRDGKLTLEPQDL